MPLYAQAEKVLEDLLVRRRYRVGDRIPPEAELVRSLGVSRATIRTAVGRLADRGLLVRRQGSGTFLARLPGHACGAPAQQPDTAVTISILNLKERGARILIATFAGVLLSRCSRPSRAADPAPG